jgi:hypothetical protein
MQFGLSSKSIPRIFAGFILLSAVAALLVAPPVRAQQGRGTLSGVVQSADGTPQAKARVFLQPGNGRSAHATLTDDNGHYIFRNVRPGIYELKAHANGNWSELQRNINVRANQNVTMDLKFAPPAPPKPKAP